VYSSSSNPGNNKKEAFMKNNYKAPEVFTISTTDSFVLGAKPFTLWDADAIYGWFWSYMPSVDDIDEEEN
jgi:hypothetical protein